MLISHIKINLANESLFITVLVSINRFKVQMYCILPVMVLFFTLFNNCFCIKLKKLIRSDRCSNFIQLVIKYSTCYNISSEVINI